MERVADTPQLVDIVYQRLMAAIVDTSLVPGQRIVQADLAADLGVSRAPVSHALQVLKHQGLVRDSGKQGLEIAPIDPERVGNLYLIRSALEQLAARGAAQRMVAGTLGKSEIGTLQALLAAGERLDGKKAMSIRVQADIDFHRALYGVSGNYSIAEVMEPLWPHLQRAMVLALEANQLRRQAWRQHRQIVDRIVAGDIDGSGQAASSHAYESGIYVTERLRRALPPG
ncbi:MAG: GntR family transcriptional regulator [Janthinobacterium lividum]